MSAREERSAEGTPAVRAGHVGQGFSLKPEANGPLEPPIQCSDITEPNKTTLQSPTHDPPANVDLGTSLATPLRQEVG